MPWQKTPADRRRDATTYGTQWRNARQLALKRDANRCTSCGSTKRLQVDHITPVTQGGTHVLSNLRTLCEQCHDKITAQQGGGYRRKQTAPTIDPQPRPATQW